MPSPNNRGTRVPGKRPSLSIIIPVLRESGIIHQTLSRLRTLQGSSDVEIIVVDGDPLLSTIHAIDAPGVIAAAAGRGRALQMNHGARMASSGILLFLHADTCLPPDALLRISAALEDERLVAGAFDLGITSSRPVFRITERYVALRTRLTRIPFGDQAIFIRRDYFRQIGGYREIPLMEDVELMARIRKRRDRICIIAEQAMTSARRWEQEGIFFCPCRNWALLLLYLLGVRPERLARWYQ